MFEVNASVIQENRFGKLGPYYSYRTQTRSYSQRICDLVDSADSISLQPQSRDPFVC